MFKFSVTPLASESYYSWSLDMEVLLRGKGPWEYVERRSNETSSTGVNQDENEHAPEDISEEIKWKEAQKRNLPV